MATNRVEIGDELLESVSGGKIEYTWEDGGSGTIWIQSKATPKKYSFNNYGVVDYIAKKQDQGYSDYEIFDILKEKNLIW